MTTIKTENFFLIAMLLLAFFIGIFFSQAIINNKSAKQIARVRLLSDNTVTYVKLDSLQEQAFKVGDSVWVDTDRHLVTDSGNIVFKSVIIK